MNEEEFNDEIAQNIRENQKLEDLIDSEDSEELFIELGMEYDSSWS